MLYEQYLPLFILIAVATFVAMVVIFASALLGPRKPSKKKLAPYESGMVPIGPAVRRFPVKFYLVAVLFILFDVEIIFLLPYAVHVRQFGLYGLVVVGIFVLLLIVGLIYEWKKGALEWE